MDLSTGDLSLSQVEGQKKNKLSLSQKINEKLASIKKNRKDKVAFKNIRVEGRDLDTSLDTSLNFSDLLQDVEHNNNLFEDGENAFRNRSNAEIIDDYVI